MEIPESQLATIWKAVEYWIKNKKLGIKFLSSYTAGTKDIYFPDRIAKGIKDGSVPISSDFLHTCVWVFGLTSARGNRLDDNLTDEECIGLLTAPLIENTE